jgi:prepilin-type N-terminal cleavage/methylation domain-containing protein
MKLNTIVHTKGFTILEIIVSLFISSVLLTTVYKANHYITISTLHETTKSTLQREIITANGILSKDIRMAGLNLPGNGIRVTKNAQSNDMAEIFTNDSGYVTALSTVPGFYDFHFFVLNGAGMQVNSWVCISDPSVDTTYKYIRRVGMNATGPDTVFLYDNIKKNLTLATKIRPATRTLYYVNDTGNLIRSKNGISSKLGIIIDTLKFFPKTSAGSIVGDMGQSAAVLSVFVGGHLKSGSGFSIISDSIEINLRNRG